MGTVKVTFTLDEATIGDLERAAYRLGRPKSQIVREAVQEYAARTDRLSDAERLRMLATLDEALQRIPDKPASDVDAELDELRHARRRGGRGVGAG